MKLVAGYSFFDTFENGNNWSEEGDCASYWMYGSSTPSSGTGPQSGDSDDAGNNFVYMETSSGKCDGNPDTGYLMYINEINWSAGIGDNITFETNFHGDTQDIGIMTMEENSTGSWLDTGWSEEDPDGNNGLVWTPHSINASLLTGTGHVRFKYTDCYSYKGDAAIDKFNITGATTTTTTSTTSTTSTSTSTSTSTTTTIPGDGDPTIMLQDADTENLEDTDILEYSPSSNYGSNTNLRMLMETGYDYNFWDLIKFNISSIPTGSTIEDAQLYLYLYFNALDADTEGFNVSSHKIYHYPTYNISDSEWAEDTVTWTERPISGEYDTTKTDDNKFFGGTGEPINEWLDWNVTSIVSSSFSDGDLNVSIYLISHDMFGTPAYNDHVSVYSKEYTTDITLRPYLNISYSAPAGDTCDCPASGDWSIDCSEDCIIDSACDVQGNDILFKNSGTITVSANVYNFGDTHLSSGCIVVIGSGKKWGAK